MAYIQLSLSGKMWQEVLYREEEMILEPYLKPLQAPPFQCLILNGQTREWCDGQNLSFAGVCWTPNISERQNSCKEEREYLSYAILEKEVPTKYYISPAISKRILRLSIKAGAPLPKTIGKILIKQAGNIQMSELLRREECEPEQRRKNRQYSLKDLEI